MKKSLNKFFAYFLSITIILSFIPILVSSAEFNVYSTEPIPISNKEEFNSIRNNLSGTFYLTCDIVFTEEDFASGGDYYNNGQYFLPFSTGKTAFSGSLDGCGYSVKGLKMALAGNVHTVIVNGIVVSEPVTTASDDGWTGDYIIPTKPTVPANYMPVAGLFGILTGTVKNLSLSEVNISHTASTGTSTLYVGGIAGINKGEISNCAVTGTIGANAKSYVGGIVGYQSEGSITNCVAHVNVSSGNNCGGLVGAVAKGTVASSYCLATAGSSALPSVQLCSYNVTPNAYYVSNSVVEGFGSQLSTEVAATADAFVGFDFETVWKMDSRLNMPWLSIFNTVASGDINGDEKIDLNDVVALAQYVAGWEIEIFVDSANVNHSTDAEGNPTIDLNDVVHLAQYVAGWENIEL